MEFVRTVDLHRHVEASHSVVSDASSSNENDDDTVKDLRKETDHKSDDDDYKPEAFDPETTAWSFWTKPINSTSVGACMLKVEDSIILIGGLQVEQKLL